MLGMALVGSLLICFSACGGVAGHWLGVSGAAVHWVGVLRAAVHWLGVPRAGGPARARFGGLSKNGKRYRGLQEPALAGSPRKASLPSIERQKISITINKDVVRMMI